MVTKKAYNALLADAKDLREKLADVAIDLNMLDDFYPATGKETVYSVKRLFDFCDKMDAMLAGVTVE